MNEDWRRERKAIFRVGHAFFRPKSVLTRDLGVLAAAVLRQHNGQLMVLDAMTGCGVRSIRYVLESGADSLWTNDGNLDLESLLRQNLQAMLPVDVYRLSFLSLQKLFATILSQGDRFDWIDLDCFGSPVASLPMAIASTKIGGCIYLTATDGKSLSGQNSETALRQFNAYTRHHPAIHEQGVRVLAGLAVQQARQQGLDMLPLFSFFCGQTYRVLLKLLPKAPPADQHYGFLGYCHHCGQTQTVGWRSLNVAQCNNHKPIRPLVISGPMWLGPLHASKFLGEMKNIAQFWEWQESRSLLSLMEEEACFPPYYIPLSEIGCRGKMDIPSRQMVIHAIQSQGYEACRSSMTPQAIKTNAPIPKIIEISRGLHSRKR